MGKRKRSDAGLDQPHGQTGEPMPKINTWTGSSLGISDASRTHSAVFSHGAALAESSETLPCTRTKKTESENRKVEEESLKILSQNNESETTVDVCGWSPWHEALTSLPWMSVFWQNVLPYLSVRDKFLLRAVNRHCLGVIETEFRNARSIIPPSEPQMCRKSLAVLQDENRSAVKYELPRPRCQRCSRVHSESESCGKCCLVNQLFTNRCILRMLPRLSRLKVMDLSFSAARPTPRFFQAISENCPQLERLYLRHLTGVHSTVQLHEQALQALVLHPMTCLQILDLTRTFHDCSISVIKELMVANKSLRLLKMHTRPLLQESIDSYFQVKECFVDIVEAVLMSDIERLCLLHSDLWPSRWSSMRRPDVELDFIKRSCLTSGGVTVEMHCCSSCVIRPHAKNYASDRGIRSLIEAKGARMCPRECGDSFHLGGFRDHLCIC